MTVGTVQRSLQTSSEATTQGPAQVTPMALSTLVEMGRLVMELWERYLDGEYAAAMSSLVGLGQHQQPLTDHILAMWSASELGAVEDEEPDVPGMYL